MPTFLYLVKTEPVSDLIARAINDQSLRASKPFVKVDVGALTENTFLKANYSVIKGTFTGATQRQAR